MYDVIVSGAGPSGSKCAETLSKAGYKVALIEKDINWRKPCGGAVNYKLFDFYPQFKKLNLPKIKGKVMYSPNNKVLKFKQKHIIGTVMDRLEMDNLMRNVAVDAGAELFDKNISISFITKNQKKIGINTKSTSGIKSYYGNIIILAEGMSSKLALKSGLRSKWKREDIGIAKCAIIEGEHQFDNEMNYFFFNSQNGYEWVFPLGKNKINIGVGISGNINCNLNNIFEEFLSNHNIKKFMPNLNYKTIWKGSYSLPICGVLKNSLYADNLMLIGDTAGFVSPISGGGLYRAVLSGNISAEVAINALMREDFSKKVLSNYARNSSIKEIIKKFKVLKVIRKFISEGGSQNINKMFNLAERDPEYRKQVINLFKSKAKINLENNFIARLKNEV